MAEPKSNALPALGDVKIQSLMFKQTAENMPNAFVVGNPAGEDAGMCLEITAKNAFWFIRCAKKNWITNAEGAAVFR